jgi:aminoglycoside phosphotransferase (APT) family kinase protein
MYVDSPPLPAPLQAEPWSADAARWRLDQLRDVLPVRVPRQPEFIGGNSNDAWLLDDAVLRVCWRADRGRLIREARLLEALPAAVPHAPVVGSGRTDQFSWMISARMPGRSIESISTTMPESELRSLFGEIAAILAALHDWVPPPDVAALMAARPELDPADPMTVWAADLVPLPAPRALAMVDLAKSLEHVDPTLIEAAADRIRSLAGTDPLAGRQGIVHGDATLGNFLVHRGRITAVLDFEWARIGPPDLELVSLVRMSQGDSTDGSPLPYLSWLVEDYPAMFDVTDLDQRLWLCELSYFLRGLIWWPPDQPESRLDPDHHVHTLRRLVAAPMPR